MTNYNDGNWHGWNGGECPVHPEAVLEVQWPLNTVSYTTIADLLSWRDTFLFRVVERQRKPREWFVLEDGDGCLVQVRGDRPGAFKVREVIE